MLTRPPLCTSLRRLAAVAVTIAAATGLTVLTAPTASAATFTPTVGLHDIPGIFTDNTGSAGNITPFQRKIVYLTLCAVSNYIRKPTRPEWIAHRDFTPIEPCADDALEVYARSYRQAAE